MRIESGDREARLLALAENLRGRRTIVLFEDRPVEIDKLVAAIDVARWAPNHHLSQPWHFYVLGSQARQRMLDLTRTITAELRDEDVAERKVGRWADVPQWLAVTCAVTDDELAQLEDYAACCCAIQNFSLYLWQSGIGMKWSTGPITRDQRFYDSLGIDHDRETIIALISCGYPRKVPDQQRRPAAEIVTRLD